MSSRLTLRDLDAISEALSAKLAGAIAFLLWFGVVLAGCAFILFE